MKNKVVLFTTQKYRYMEDIFLKNPLFERGVIKYKLFPDGERYQKVDNSIRNKKVVILGGTITDSDTLEIYDLACGLSKFGAKSLTIVIPYYGYSTMERAIKKNEIVTAKTRARLLSSIPLAHEGNHIILIDIHSEGIPHYFEGGVTSQHLYAKPVIIKAIKDIANGEDFVLACTDSGRAKWVESLANNLGVSAAFVLKKRISGSDTKVLAVSAQVKDKIVIIYDDMIRTGSSLIKAAEAYKNGGAKKIFAIATHGIFPNQAIEKIKKCNIFEKIIVTNSHPNSVKLSSNFLKVYSITPLIEKTLLEIV